MQAERPERIWQKLVRLNWDQAADINFIRFLVKNGHLLHSKLPKNCENDV